MLIKKITLVVVLVKKKTSLPLPSLRCDLKSIERMTHLSWLDKLLKQI